MRENVVSEAVMSLDSEIEFCFNFLKNVDAAKNCTIYSPASVLNSLAIILAGSDGTTAEEIAAVIGKNIDKDQVITYYSEFSRQFVSKNNNDINNTSNPLPSSSAAEENFSDVEKNSDSEESSDDLTTDETEDQEECGNDSTPLFKVINSNGLFVNHNIKLHSNFEKLIADKFFVQLQKVDFNDRKTSAKIINNYVKNSTNGKIENIIDADSLHLDTSAALVNAIYFIGKWYNSFKPRFKASFYSSPSSPKEIEFMSENLYLLNFTEGKTWKCCGIPYKGHKYWMFFVLPKDDYSLEELIEAVDYSMFQQWTMRKPAALNLTIPLFEISCDFDLSQTLPALGIRDLFSYDKCNLSQMFVAPHYIDKSVHKATIKVNEYGTEASAATYSSMCPQSGRILDKFVADHPFLYFIVAMEDENIKNILFAGTFL